MAAARAPAAGADGFTTQVPPGWRPGLGGQPASRGPQGPPVKPEIVLPQSQSNSQLVLGLQQPVSIRV